MSLRFLLWSLVAVWIIGLLPLGSAMLAGTVASLFECPLNEGNSYPCMVLGVDIGGQLYTAGVAGWFMLVSIPYAAVASCVLILVYSVLWLVRRLT